MPLHDSSVLCITTSGGWYGEAGKKTDVKIEEREEEGEMRKVKEVSREGLLTHHTNELPTVEEEAYAGILPLKENVIWSYVCSCLYFLERAWAEGNQ
eukprot:gene474-254_t